MTLTDLFRTNQRCRNVHFTNIFGNRNFPAHGPTAVEKQPAEGYLAVFEGLLCQLPLCSGLSRLGTQRALCWAESLDCGELYPEDSSEYCTFVLYLLVTRIVIGLVIARSKLPVTGDYRGEEHRKRKSRTFGTAGERGRRSAEQNSKLESPDDLRALLSRAALSESQYREFSAPERENESAQGDNGAEARTPGALESEAANGNGNDHGNGQAKPAAARLQAPLHESTLAEEIAESIEAKKPAATVAPSAEAFEAKIPAFKHSNGGNGNGAKPTTQAADVATAARKRPEAAISSGSSGASSAPIPSGASGASMESRWSVLGRALSGEPDDSPGHLIQTLSNSVSVPFAFVAPISGGTGVTTILATLARCFAARGERVLLADQGAASLLPLYFGAANPAPGNYRAFP